MKYRGKLIAAALLAGIPFIYWLVSYHPAEFRGAGPLEDTGFFTYPRYHAPVGAVPLAAPGSHTFRFSGTPSEDFVLMFYLPGKTDKDRRVFENLSTKLTAVILDQNGNVACSAVGSPTGTTEKDKWFLMSSDRESGFWHSACNKVRLSRGTEYELTVKVEAVDFRTPAIDMLAMVEGGGNEFP